MQSAEHKKSRIYQRKGVEIITKWIGCDVFCAFQYFEGRLIVCYYFSCCSILITSAGISLEFSCQFLELMSNYFFYLSKNKSALSTSTLTSKPNAIYTKKLANKFSSSIHPKFSISEVLHKQRLGKSQNN